VQGVELVNRLRGVGDETTLQSALRERDLQLGSNHRNKPMADGFSETLMDHFLGREIVSNLTRTWDRSLGNLGKGPL
jgi:hypothetical protein